MFPFHIRNSILLFTNITGLEDKSFDGGFRSSESNRKAREHRRNEDFADELGRDILYFLMNLSSSAASVPNKCKTQLDKNSGGSTPRKHKNVSKLFDSRMSIATNL